MPHTYELIREQWIPQPLDSAFSFFSRPQNLEEITPPWLGFHIVKADDPLHTGSLIEYKLRVRGLPMRWVSEITDWNPPHGFVDLQLKGPYSLWHHEHSFAAENGGTRIRDHVRYALPFGVLGELMHGLIVRRDVESIFAFRQKRLWICWDSATPAGISPAIVRRLPLLLGCRSMMSRQPRLPSWSGSSRPVRFTSW